MPTPFLNRSFPPISMIPAFACLASVALICWIGQLLKYPISIREALIETGIVWISIWISLWATRPFRIIAPIKFAILIAIALPPTIAVALTSQSAEVCIGSFVALFIGIVFTGLLLNCLRWDPQTATFRRSTRSI